MNVICEERIQQQFNLDGLAGLSVASVGPKQSGVPAEPMVSSAAGRKRTKSERKVCKDGRVRLIPRPRTHEENIEVFWSQVKRGLPDECWIWIGPKKENGNGLWYGKLWNGKRNIPAHRFSYELANGPLAQGMLACHRCDNPICVNPAHLFSGTYGDNNRDAVAKGRHKIGEDAVNSVLTENDVRNIRAQYIPWVFGYRKLAKKFGVKDSTIQDIIEGKTWKHVPRQI